MSFAIAFVLMTQTAASGVAIVPPKPASAAERAPIAQSSTATVRVLRPERISASLQAPPEERSNAAARRIQRRRDEAGTIWIEFS